VLSGWATLCGLAKMKIKRWSDSLGAGGVTEKMIMRKVWVVGRMERIRKHDGTSRRRMMDPTTTCVLSDNGHVLCQLGGSQIRVPTDLHSLKKKRSGSQMD
jgi:hypothetical protein